MAEKEVRKTTKKPVRKAAPKKAATKSVPATKTAVRKTPKKVVASRKAPTKIAVDQRQQKKSNVLLLSGLFVSLLVVIGAIVFGVLGDGQINIESTIADVKDAASPEEKELIGSIQVQKTAVVDGGLVPSGVPVEAPKPTPIASTTENSASSTDSLASTTLDTSTSTDIVNTDNSPAPSGEEASSTPETL